MQSSTADIEQVAKDVDRSFIGSAFQHLFSSSSNDATPAQDKALRRKQLTHLILTTLSRYPSLHYFQGYHDIVAVILLTLSPDRPSPNAQLFPHERQQAQIELVVERISLHLIRDSMTRDLLPIMGQLKMLGNLLRSVDPLFAELVDRASPLPFFALPWLLTLLTHDVTDVAVMRRVLEFVLAYGPASAIYLCAAVLLVRKEEIEGMDVDELEDPAMLHTILSRLPSIIADVEDSADSIGSSSTRSAEESQTERRNGNSTTDSNLIYTDPDVELPSLASDRALAASSRSSTDDEPKTAKTGTPISTLLQEAVALMQRFPLPCDALEAEKIMGPSSVLFTWPSTFDSAHTLDTKADRNNTPDSSSPDEPLIDWQTLNAQAESALTGPTDAIVRDPHPPSPTPPASDFDEKLSDEKHSHRKRRLSLSEQKHQARMLAVVGLSGLLVAALFTASQQSPVTTASQVVAGGTEETKRVLALVVSLLSNWGRVVGSAQ
uniref:Rab-GAP TBC domain-containing protein n=1 Tax=Kalmanozyma brasiliensis (strain GHG001) TaxID=1365824 RepID=V5ESR4_KALBG